MVETAPEDPHQVFLGDRVDLVLAGREPHELGLPGVAGGLLQHQRLQRWFGGQGLQELGLLVAGHRQAGGVDLG